MLLTFSIFTYKKGYDAGLILAKDAYYRVEKLIKIFSESFEISGVEGYSITEFYQEIDRKNGNRLKSDLIQQSFDC